jgi:hypothetical protein
MNHAHINDLNGSSLSQSVIASVMKEVESDEVNDFMVDGPFGTTAGAFFFGWSGDGVLPLSKLLTAPVTVEVATDVAHDLKVECSLLKPCRAAVETLFSSWSTSDLSPLSKLLTASVTVEAVIDAANDFWEGSLFGSFAAESGTTLAVAVGGEAGGVG